MDVKVSIVIPYFSESAFIVAAVRSALNQTFGDAYEVILVDDGSDRPVTEVLTADLLGSPKLYIMRQENQGAAAARHAGIQRATGRWITFLDADDEVASVKLARQVAAAEALDSPMAVIFTGTEQRPTGSLKWCGLMGGCVEITDDILRCRLPPLASMLLSRKLYFDCGGFDTAVRKYEDLLLLARLICANARFYVIPEPLYIQTIHADSSINSTLYGLESIDGMLKEITDLFSRNGIEAQLSRFLSRPLLGTVARHLKRGHYAYCFHLVQLFRRYQIISPGWQSGLLAYVAINAATLGAVNTLLWNLSKVDRRTGLRSPPLMPDR